MTTEREAMEAVVREAIVSWNTLGTAKADSDVSAHIADVLLRAGLAPVPAHINDVTGRFCRREGLMAGMGRCPDGCDHAEHYANDGHPECDDEWHD